MDKALDRANCMQSVNNDILLLPLCQHALFTSSTYSAHTLELGARFWSKSRRLADRPSVPPLQGTERDTAMGPDLATSRSVI